MGIGAATLALLPWPDAAMAHGGRAVYRYCVRADLLRVVFSLFSRAFVALLPLYLMQ